VEVEVETVKVVVVLLKKKEKKRKRVQIISISIIIIVKKEKVIFQSNYVVKVNVKKSLDSSLPPSTTATGLFFKYGLL
jgi:hypothetical protein